MNIFSNWHILSLCLLVKECKLFPFFIRGDKNQLVYTRIASCGDNFKETGPYVCEHLLFMKYKCSIYCNALEVKLKFSGGWGYKYGHERLHSNESNCFTLFYFFYLSFSFCVQKYKM